MDELSNFCDHTYLIHLYIPHLNLQLGTEVMFSVRPTELTQGDPHVVNRRSPLAGGLPDCNMESLAVDHRC